MVHLARNVQSNEEPDKYFKLFTFMVSYYVDFQPFSNDFHQCSLTCLIKICYTSAIRI
jgi:hypothetical protein